MCRKQFVSWLGSCADWMTRWLLLAVCCTWHDIQDFHTTVPAERTLHLVTFQIAFLIPITSIFYTSSWALAGLLRLLGKVWASPVRSWEVQLTVHSSDVKVLTAHSQFRTIKYFLGLISYLLFLWGFRYRIQRSHEDQPKRRYTSSHAVFLAFRNITCSCLGPLMAELSPTCSALCLGALWAEE